MNPAVDNHQDIHQNGARIGYVLKVYPRFSETFIVTEILAREAQGEDLSIYALRPTTDSRFHPEIARAAGTGHRPVEPAHRRSAPSGRPRALRRHHAGAGRPSR